MSYLDKSLCTVVKIKIYLCNYGEFKVKLSGQKEDLVMPWTIRQLDIRLAGNEHFAKS